MAFNNQPNHYQMHGGFPSLEGDHVGYGEGNYVPVMNGVARKYSRLSHVRDSRITMHSCHRLWP